jgi:hypothetical protein
MEAIKTVRLLQSWGIEPAVHNALLPLLTEPEHLSPAVKKLPKSPEAKIPPSITRVSTTTALANGTPKIRRGRQPLMIKSPKAKIPSSSITRVPTTTAIAIKVPKIRRGRVCQYCMEVHCTAVTQSITACERWQDDLLHTRPFEPKGRIRNSIGKDPSGMCAMPIAPAKLWGEGWWLNKEKNEAKGAQVKQASLERKLARLNSSS